MQTDALTSVHLKTEIINHETTHAVSYSTEGKRILKVMKYRGTYHFYLHKCLIRK